METLKHWKARRSGGRITITAADAAGSVVKRAGIDTIERAPDGRVIAKDHKGNSFLLA